MPACPRCGEQNPARARFCLACGAALPAEPSASLEVRKTVTVLFCDVTGSTTLGEGRDPEQLRRVMTRYFEQARLVLERHGGRVEKFIGDAVMAVFGVPAVHEDDALRAVRAAAELRQEIALLNEELERSLGARIDVRIGVNTGEVLAGDPAKSDSFVLGDAVNVAQRLEASAAPGEILIGDATYRLARDALHVEPLGPIEVKGKTEPVHAHRLLDVLPGLPAHARRFDSPMVGRGRELALLQEAFARAVGESACHLFTVLGAAGVGKSRLVAEALAEISGQATVASGSCLSYGEGITFWPVLEIVRQAAGILPDAAAGEALAKLETVFEGDEAGHAAALRVAELVGIAETGAVGEEGFWAVRKLFEALARRRPLVLVFDDLNWAEPTLLDLVEHVADWSREAPILLVCMARPDLLDLRPGWGGGKRNAATIFLEPLSELESGRLLENLLLGAVGSDVRGRIQDAAEGNPLFVEEMVSMLIDEGLLRRDARGWTAIGDLGRVEVPPSIQVLLASRLDQLGTDERQVLERAAVEGTVFHRGAVEALTGEPSVGRVADCLLSLIRKELLRPAVASVPGEEAFRFRHALIRDAAYDALPKQVRADLHERFAAWLDGRLGESDEFAGYHLEQAYRYRAELARVSERERALAERAGSRLAAAGRRALAHGDAPAAANLLERAAALLASEGQAHLRVMTDLGVALRELGEFGQAGQVLEQALAGARRSRDRSTELRVTIERASVALLSDPSQADAILQQVEAALPALEELGDDRALAMGWTLIGQLRGSWRGRFADGEEALERALQHARRGGDRRQEAPILRELALAAVWGPRSVDEAAGRCREILELAGGDPLIEAGILRSLAELEARRGSFEEARRLARRASSIYDDVGVLGVMPVSVAFALGEIELLAEDYKAAERELRAGWDALDRIGEQGYRSSAAAFLAQALYGQQRMLEAEEFALRAQEAAAPDDIWSQVVSRGTRAKVLSSRGDHGSAEKLAREAVGRLADTDGLDIRAGALADLGEVLLRAGRRAEAGHTAAEALRLCEQKGNLVTAARMRRLAARAAENAVMVAEDQDDRAS